MPRPLTLTDLQLVLLSHAAQRESGHVFPLPPAASDQDRAITDLKALLRRGLLTEIETPDPAARWREDGDLHYGLVITDRGNAALGLGDEEPGRDTDAASTAPDNPPAPAGAPRDLRAGSKIANVLALLRREGGATLAELVEATGWLPHTTRAALTGLKKKGHEVAKGKRGEATCYHVTGER